jgi:hypothetical protein
MLAQGMQGGLSGFGTSGLQTFAKGGRMSNVEMERMKIKDWYKKNFKTDELGDELNPNTTFDDLFSAILNGDVYSAMGVHDSVVRERLFSKLSKIKGRYENYAYELYVKYGDKPLGSYAKGGEIIDQYEGRTPADIWFNLTKSQRRHLLLDHANIPSGELSSYIGYDTNYDDLPHFVKQIVKKHFAEGQYARGGKLSPAQERAFFNKTKTKFTQSDAERLVGKFIEIYGQGQDEPIAFSKIVKATIDPKYSQKTLVIYTEMGTQERVPEDKIDAFFHGLTIVLSIPSKGSYYGLKLKKQGSKYADGGKFESRDRFSSARTMGRDSQNWESELKEYAGEHYKSLTPRERAEIIADMQRGYDRNTHFAKGGEITHLPESRKVSKEEIEQFIRYVDSFYGKQGIYADMLDGGYTKSEIRKAVMTYLNKLDSQQTWGGGDSLDRERIKEILHQTYARGGQTSTYEVHLEAVPNIDYDQSDYRANVRVSKLKKSAKSIDEAVRIAKNFIEDNDLGGGNFIPAKLYKNGKQIGFISYNGRVWNNDQSEIKYAKGGKTENNNYRKQNEDIAKQLLVGQTIKSVKFLDKKNTDRFGWSKSPMSLQLSHGLEIFPSKDDELNDAGSYVVRTTNDKDVRMRVLPSISKSEYADGGSVGKKQSKFQLGDKVYSFYNPTKSASIVDLYFKAWDTLDNIPHENDTYFYELSLPDGTTKKLAESALSETPLKGNKSKSKSMDVQFIEYKDNEIMYEPTSKKYYANDVEFDSLLKAKKFLDSGKVSSNIRGAYQKGLFAKGGQTSEKFFAYVKHGVIPIKSVSLWKNRQSTQEPTKENIFEFLNNVPSDERICIYDSNVTSINGELHSAKTPLYSNGAEAVSKIVDEKENIIWEKSSHNSSFAKGGEVKNTIDILMTEEPKVWDKFGFNSGSEIRASKDKTKKYAQELERVFTEKGVKKGSLTKKINEDLTDENYHLLNEFLTRNGYFNSKLTDELLKSYNNPVYSGSYADKEAMTIEEKAKPKTSVAKKIQDKKLSAKTTYIPNREIESIELESGETLSKNDIIDGVYRAKKKFAQGGGLKEAVNYARERRYFAEKEEELWEKQNKWFDKLPTSEKQKLYNELVGRKKSLDFIRESDILAIWNKVHNVSSDKYAKGGKVGFEGLAKKVAKRYVGRKVSKEYQAEYGKTYDAKEAKEVGNKVAGKVYQQQVAKKKIVRKLQRKTN